MTDEDWNDLLVETTRIYSLDRCIKCLNVLNLGPNCFCTVVLKREKRDGGKPPGERPA